MGNSSSSPVAAQRSGAADSLSARDQKAFQVLAVYNNSPASRAKLVPYFDYIVSVNGVTVLQESPNVVAEMARSQIDRPLRLSVYNSRNDSVREVTVVPSTSWGGEGLLGCSIRFSTTLNAVDRCWRVLRLFDESPASIAGLIAEKDWIIGSAELNILEDEDLHKFLIQNRKVPLKIIIFNIDSQTCRIATIVPDFEWGGPGCLGCDIGTGILNRIPNEVRHQEVPPIPVATLMSPIQDQTDVTPVKPVPVPVPVESTAVNLPPPNLPTSNPPIQMANWPPAADQNPSSGFVEPQHSVPAALQQPCEGGHSIFSPQPDANIDPNNPFNKYF
jgi:hypothetical protein